MWLLIKFEVYIWEDFMAVSATSISEKTLEKVVEDIAHTGANIIYTVLIFVAGVYLSRLIKRVTARFLLKYNVSRGITNFIVYGIYIAMLSVVVLTCLERMGIKTTSVVAVLGAAGFSVGLAFKEILSNIGSGMIILFFKPFSIGDYIQGSGVEGSVSDIQVFSTVLKTPDNKTVIVPNFQLTSNNIINYTHQEKRRVDFSYNIAYDSDIDLVKKVLNDIFKEDIRIVEDPKPIVGINSIANNAIQIVARPWVNTEDYWDVYFDIMEKVKKNFDKYNIEVAFLQGFIYNNSKPNGTNDLNIR